jgi:hypothetical protein
MDHTFIRDLQTSSPLLHQIIGVFLIVTTIISWLIAWFLLRNERVVTGTWRLHPYRLGVALAAKLFWEGNLTAAFGLLVMFSESRLPYWSLIMVVGLFLSSMLLLRVYADQEGLS